MKIEHDLDACVAEHVSEGCVDRSGSLGIQRMPQGYALMLNADRSHYYWLRKDGEESVIHWDRWAVYRWAKKDAEREVGNKANAF